MLQEKIEFKKLPLITFAHLMNDLYMMLLPPLLPILISIFKLSYSIAGAFVSLVLFISFLSSLPIGYLADAKNCRKNVLVAGFFLYALSILLFSLTKSFSQLLFACIIIGIAQATYHPQATSIINFFTKKNRGNALGIHGIGGSIGHFLAPIAIGFLATIIEWRLGLFLLFIPAIVMAIILWRMLEEPSIQPVKGFAKGITLPLILLTFAVSMRDMAYEGLVSFLPSYFVVKGQSIFHSGMLTALMLISGVIAQPLGGTLSDKIGRKKIFILTMLLLTVSLAGFAISKGIVSLIFLPLIGVGIFSTFPVAFIYASELVGFERSGASIGFMYGASQLIASTSPLFMGYVIDNWGFTASFYLLIFFAGLAFIASIAIRK